MERVWDRERPQTSEEDEGREGGRSGGGLTLRGKGRAGTPRPQGRGDRTVPAPQWGGPGEKGDREKLQVPPADPQRAGREGHSPSRVSDRNTECF